MARRSPEPRARGYDALGEAQKTAEFVWAAVDSMDPPQAGILTSSAGPGNASAAVNHLLWSSGKSVGVIDLGTRRGLLICGRERTGATGAAREVAAARRWRLRPTDLA